jgi:hypothetical protein
MEPTLLHIVDAIADGQRCHVVADGQRRHVVVGRRNRVSSGMGPKKLLVVAGKLLSNACPSPLDLFKRRVGFGSGHGLFITARTRPVPSVGSGRPVPPCVMCRVGFFGLGQDF